MVFAKGKPDKPGGGTEPASIEIFAVGALTAFQSCQEKLDASSNEVLCNKGAEDHKIFLGDFFLNHNFDNGVGTVCFGAGIFPVTAGLSDLKDGTGEAYFRWWAPDTTGELVLYRLHVIDHSGWSTDFPPAAGETIFIDGDDWLLTTSNKRTSRNACVGSGSFTDDGQSTVGGTEAIVEFYRAD
jgi:hypothetical protein